MSEHSNPNPSVWERSTIVRFFRWLCSGREMLRVFTKQRMRRAFIVVAWIVTILALVYGEEDWRGRRAWDQYRQATEARGESLDLASYIPKPVPDDQNFAATPFLQSFMLLRQSTILTNDFYARVSDHIKTPPSTSGRRHFEDLVAWQQAWSALQSGPLERTRKFETDDTSPSDRAAAAAAILPGMKSAEAEFAELRAASTRESSRFPLKYDLVNPWSVLIPHLPKLKQASEQLNWEACAELAAGQPDQALADVKLCLALADSVKSEPLLISMLVRIACLHIAIQPVWEGLAEHRWNDQQLTELETRFSSYDFPADAVVPLNAERTQVVPLLNIARKGGIGSLQNFSDREVQLSFGELAIDLLSRVVPSGWFNLEQLNYCLRFDSRTKDVIDVAAKKLSPSQFESNERELESKGPPFQALLHHRLLASLLVPSLKNFFVGIAAAQVATDEAELACALERYRLANGQYPETLEALTPRFIKNIPNDVIGGQPYKYRRTEDGRFLLYSVGWNEKDDGGVPGKTLFDTTQGDWVWTYPGQ